MTYFVTSKGNMAVLQELVAEQVGKGMVLFVEGEDGGVWSTCTMDVSGGRGAGIRGFLRVSIFSSIFFSPSPSMKASVLSFEGRLVDVGAA